MNAAFDTRPADEEKVAFFLTDGDDGGDFGPIIAETASRGIVVNTFSVGGNGRPCDPGEPVFDIADGTGGTCTVVMNPTDLTGSLGGVTPTGINRVDVALNGGTPVEATINAVGEWTAAEIGTYVEGPNVITATAVADDGTMVTADITVNGVATPGDVTCNGLTPTITGTDGDDNLIGTDGPDVIVGLGGNDTIIGLRGDDVICGGPGDDVIDAGPQDDLVFGEGGNDTLRGNNGKDTLYGGDDDDRLFGGPDVDSCDGQAGTNIIAPSCEII